MVAPRRDKVFSQVFAGKINRTSVDAEITSETRSGAQFLKGEAGHQPPSGMSDDDVLTSIRRLFDDSGWTKEKFVKETISVLQQVDKLAEQQGVTTPVLASQDMENHAKESGIKPEEAPVYRGPER